jgi:hypothetical protein
MTEIDWNVSVARLIAGRFSPGKRARPAGSLRFGEWTVIARYRMFAGYNAWCNTRLYDAAARLRDADYRANHGAFFKSLHGTLNHLLVGDRIWMQRFTGEGEIPKSLDAILYDDFAGLRAARGRSCRHDPLPDLCAAGRHRAAAGAGA